MATATPTNLWPRDIAQEASDNELIKLLKEQAALLSELTDDLVTAEVRGADDSGGATYVDDFYLFGPQIRYRHLLFSIQYPIELGYPAMLYSGILGDQTLQIKNEESLRKALCQLFNNDKTRQIIGAIIARSKQDN